MFGPEVVGVRQDFAASTLDILRLRRAIDNFAWSQSMIGATLLVLIELNRTSLPCCVLLGTPSNTCKHSRRRRALPAPRT